MKKNVFTATLLLISLAQAHAAPVNTSLASQPRAFIQQDAVKGRLNKLMGLVNTRFLQKSFGTVSTLQNGAGVVAVTGCRPHDCAANGSLVVYDGKHDAFKVWLTINGKTRVYADKSFAADLNSDVKAYAENSQ